VQRGNFFLRFAKPARGRILSTEKSEVVMRKLLDIPRLPDWFNLAIGVLLFISPWALGFTDLPDPSRNAWISGAAVVVIAVCALLALKEWEEWQDIAIGVWIMIAPLVLDFTQILSAMYAHLLLGELLIISAAWEIWRLRRTRQPA
jgi:hypothetical protein